MLQCQRKHSHGNNFYIILQALAFLSLSGSGVNGDSTGRATQRWRPNPVTPIGREGFEVITRQDDNKARQEFARATSTKKAKTKFLRTTLPWISGEDPCDFLALDCLRAYQTGRICARTVLYFYTTFKNYCMMDYANCMLRYQTWLPLHMGDCFILEPYKTVVEVSVESSKLMDNIYLPERNFED